MYLMYVFSVRNFILMFHKHFIVWFLSLFKSFFLAALTYIGLSFPLQEKLHMHKMEYTYSWQSSNVLDILYFLYFSKGEEDIPIGIPMTDTVFVVKDNEGQTVTKGKGLLYIGRLFFFILHWFFLSSQIALTLYIFVVYCHWLKYSFSGTLFLLSNRKK